MRNGFTLIELSIALVIIGLIVGGVLVGRDLIKAAEARAQISQIERYQQAVNTFRGKYGYLPGDIRDPDAQNFGFKGRGSAGQGDGDGFITGSANNNNVQNGEDLTFWVDLTTAKMIDGSFTTASPGDAAWSIPSASLYKFYPPGKIGSNYVYVYVSGGWNGSIWSRGNNYFGLSAISTVNFEIFSNPGLTVQQAAAIDVKMDDGLPQGGRVIAKYADYARSTNGYVWAAGGSGALGASPGVAAAASPTTCYDNQGTATDPMLYSMTQSGGSGVNCALSFRFQ
jgi:prepilin-type N-terminal cleavage/methylation domain-containing protein